MKKTYFHLFLVTIVGILIYSNTLNSPFLWDDDWLIVENSRIKDLSNFTDCSGTRYLTFLSFAINYKLNGLNVTGYHIFNIAVHILNAMLVYLLITVIYKTPYFIPPFNSPLTKGRFSGVALFSGLIFVSHPVCTMAVTYINQRSILLVTFFYLLSIVTFIKARLSPSFNSPLAKGGLRGVFPLATDRQRKVLWYLTSVVSAVFAMKCKEVSITLPAVIFLSDRFFFKDKWKKSVVYIIPILLTLFIIPFSKPQIDVFGTSDPNKFRIEDKSILSGLDAEKLSTISRKDYTFTGFRMILTYIRLLFFPFNLNFDYDYPKYHSFFEPNVLLSFLFVLTIFSVSIFLFYRSRLNPPSPPFRKGGAGGFSDHRLISFGVFWFFITLSIESFIVVLNYPIFEYRLYLPSIGIILLSVGLSGHMITYLRNKLRYISGAVILIVISFSAITYMRNEITKDNVSLWEDVVKKSPLKASGYNNLGFSYYKIGVTDKAIESYHKAISINPNLIDAYSNRGLSYFSMGQYDLAIKDYGKEIELSPNSADGYFNRGTVYFNAGQYDMGIEDFTKAIELNPRHVEAYNNRGLAYYKKGLLDHSIQDFSTVISLNPNYADAYTNRGNAFNKKGQPDKAYEDIKRGMELSAQKS